MEFVDEDDAYLRWVAAHPEGFVLNTNRSPRADYLMLHRATCHTISGEPARGSQWTRDYMKVCGSREDLYEWARRTAGGVPTECSMCF
jgi:hypothetical protein